MFEALPDNGQGSHDPEIEARPPVSPPVQGTAPAWDPAGSTSSLDEPAASAYAESEIVSEPIEHRPPVSEPNDRISAGMTETAERIGNVMGNAQRQWRRGLELVRRPTGRPVVPIRPSSAEHASLEIEQREHLSAAQESRLMSELEEEFANARREAAVRLDRFSEQAGNRLQILRRQLRSRFATARARAQEFADVYPLQTIAAIAGTCFVLGMALRFSKRSSRG